jgi:hypothetical protein
MSHAIFKLIQNEIQIDQVSFEAVLKPALHQIHTVPLLCAPVTLPCHSLSVL